MSTSRAWFLVKRPVKEITSEHLELREVPIPSPKDGEVLIKVKYVSIDPTHRVWMSAADQYMEPVAIGSVMRAAVIGEVIVSNNVPAVPVGTFVSAFGGVQDHVIAAGNSVQPLDTSIPLTSYLSVLGVVIGLTAYHGVKGILKVKPGEVVVVSGAAGAVGSLVGQLAKDAGAKKVIGIVGSADKAAWLTKEAGFDAAINYKSEDVLARLKELAPEGVDGYFENVGGKISEAVFRCFNNYGRVAVCGLISAYNDENADVALSNFQMILHRRLTVQGFICMDHADQMPECIAKLGGMLKEGKLKYKEDVQKGLERYIEVVNMLFDGSNSGKLILEL
eukprot:c2211_g1_i1.p1 GENE.c2211_g1_i1~~c2211_g1_i1.p1  ORF type:complete len:335 (+),score=111.75 c2211_g1_i1:68-1072(+)